MGIQTSTLRPGLLVSLKTGLSGNISYRTSSLESRRGEDGSHRAKWETERTIADEAEHEEAVKVRSKARGLIAAVCSHSAFGLLCPETAEDELSKAIEEAQQLATEFNEKARITRLGVYVMAGRIAPDDVEAVKAINSEVRDLLADMERGVRNLDVDVIRAAANKARGLGAMLTPDAAARINVAIEAARKAARQIVKAGEAAGAEIDKRAIRAITESRTAFLDLEDAAEIAEPAAAGRAIDMVPVEPVGIAAAPARAVALDL